MPATLRPERLGGAASVLAVADAGSDICVRPVRSRLGARLRVDDARQLLLPVRVLVSHLGEAGLERRGERLHRSEAIAGILGHRLRDHGVDTLGHIGARVPNARHRIADVLHCDRHQAVAGVWRPTREQLVGNHSQRVLVGALVAPAAVRLLRREVLARSEHRARGGECLVGVQCAGDPEVRHLRGAAPVDEDVVRLDVTVHDPELVRERERAGDLAGEVQGESDRKRPDALDHRLQVLAVDVLEDDELTLLPLASVDDRDDVRMRETGNRARLAAEALDVLGVAPEVLVEHLDGHATLEHGVVRPVDGRHAALADEQLQLVPADDQLSYVHRHSLPCRRWRAINPALL